MARPDRRPAGHVPGGYEMWLVIGGELLASSLFFILFAWYRGDQPELFARSQQLLDRDMGLANTIVLLTSSLLVAIAVRRERLDRPSYRPLMVTTAGCGVIFGILKVFEYREKFMHGVTPLTNDFFMLYFAFTGIHMIHVTIGSVLLLVMARLSAHCLASGARTTMIECGATFWHLVDLLWIMLFGLLYLAGGTASHG